MLRIGALQTALGLDTLPLVRHRTPLVGQSAAGAAKRQLSPSRNEIERPPNNIIRPMEHMCSLTRRQAIKGFTLIEVMIVVAIISILATIALPSYRDYVLRGRLVDAQNVLSAGRANMERYYQDNRTYAVVGAITPPCAATQGLFTLSCSAGPTADSYTLSATGSGTVASFVYTVDQLDRKSTVITSGPTGWNSGTTCWITKRGQAC